MKPDRDRPLVVRFVRAFGHAFAGVAIASRDRMFRAQFVAAIVAVALASWLGATRGEWSLLALAIALVLALETMNTAIESAVDLASPEFHPLAKRAKDLAAGAVLLASFGAAAVGAIVLGPKLWSLVH